MTVKQAFEKAYGPLPEGATCHAGFFDHAGDVLIRPTIRWAEDFETLAASPLDGRFGPGSEHIDAFDPDISDRPASAFVGFFGSEYDNAVLHDHDKTAGSPAENAGEGPDFARTEKE